MKPSNKKLLKKLLAGAGTSSALMLLPACGIPCLRHADSGPTLPGAYSPKALSPESPPEPKPQPGPGPLKPAAATDVGSVVKSADFKQAVDNAIELSDPPARVKQASAAVAAPSALKGANGFELEAAGLAKSFASLNVLHLASFKGTGSDGAIVRADYTAVPTSNPVAKSEIKGGFGADSSASTGLDEFFKDPVLVRMILLAVEGNQELKILNEEIQIARNEVISRRGAYLPFVSFGNRVGMERTSRFTRNGAVDDVIDITPGQLIPNPLSSYSPTFDLFWQLDIWRELRNARDAALQRYVGVSEKRNSFVTKLVAEVAENYYELMALDNRLEILNQTIDLQEKSLKVAEANKAAGRGTELGVQRFLAEVRKNQSEKRIVEQDIVEVENRINFLVGRYPERVDRAAVNFIDLNLQALDLGMPSQLLQNRPDIREAERELVAAGLDLRVARARFFPTVTINAGVGYDVFDPRYLFNPQALMGGVVGNLVAPIINKKAIQADYMSANARQLQAVYNYQRTVLNAFTEVINRISKAENYRKSIELKKQQLTSLESSVEVASKLFQNARAEYVDVLFAQRDLMDARMVIVETKKQQLGAVVSTYQALGGGNLLAGAPLPEPRTPHRFFVPFWKSPIE